MKPFYSIGEFSQITGLSIKTLRFYHERRILLPSSIDESSGYRFYDEGKIEKARVIMWLRRMEFPLEDDANFEPCFPIRREVPATGGISIRQLPGGRCLALMHRGPYDQLGRSYAKILKQLNERKLNPVLPTREVYVKGPGMIFKGNPRNYLTEIQLPLGA